MINKHHPYKQHGLSLIELMISMTLGLLLMSMVATVMINSKRAYNIQTDMAYLQENARFAMDFLSNDLRMAGFYGCTGTLPLGVNPVLGNNNNGITNNDSANNNGSDVLRISFMDTNNNAFSVIHCPDSANCPQKPQALMVTPLKQGESSIPMTNRGDIAAQDIVIASDCGGSNTYKVASIGAENIVLTTPLKRTYSNAGQSYGAQLRRLRTHRYFIGKIANTLGEDDYSLFRDHRKLNDPLNPDTAELLIEGVENLQLRYGVDSDTDGVPERYFIATEVLDWNQVVSVQISLLMRTLLSRNDRDPDIRTFQLDPDDFEYGPVGDYRRRILFTSTVLLRNNSLR